MVNFPHKLKELRKSHNLKQIEVAKAIGVESYTVGNWETNRSEPSIEDLSKLADYFQVSVDYLIGRADDFGNITVRLSEDAALTRTESELLIHFKKLSPVEQDIMLKQITALSEEK